MIKSAQEAARLKDTYVSPQQLAGILGLHPFVAQKALWQVKNFTFDKLKQIYRLLLDLDLKLKTSQAKPKVLFDLFIAQI